ncbi:unnamed protein product [Caenorhabditis brenneri]
MGESVPPPARPRRKPAAGRVRLDDHLSRGERFYTIGHLRWKISTGTAITHGFDEIRLTATNIKEEDSCHVLIEIHALEYFPKRMMFWHVFDTQRNSFCIPLPSTVVLNNDTIPAPMEGKLQRGRPTGSWIRIALDPKIWRYQNWQFPFADLILKVGNEELYVNKRILAGGSRFFKYILMRGREKTIKRHEVLYVKDVTFEDLYDLVGNIYHGWTFYYEREKQLNIVAEQFGVHMESNIHNSFEGRAALELEVRNFIDNNLSQPLAECHIDRETVHQNYVKSFGPTFDRLWPPTLRRRPICSTFQPTPLPYAGPEVERPTLLQFQMPPVPQSGPLELHVDDGDDPGHDSNVDSDSDESEVAALIDVDETNDPDDPNNDRRETEVMKLMMPKFVGCQEFEYKDGRMSYKVSSDYEPGKENRYQFGENFSIQTCFGNWDFYLYPKMINSEKYLALGIYGTRIPDRFVNHMIFDFEIECWNQKPIRKRVEKWISPETNTIGYPNFLPWQDVEKSINKAGELLFDFTISASLRCHRIVPELDHCMFPGKKDVFVKIEDGIYPVSRDVLSEASPVLKEMFDEPVFFSRRNIFNLTGITLRQFLILMDYIYNRKSVLTRSEYYTIMVQAQRFKMEDVIEQLGRELVYKKNLRDDEAFLYAQEFGLKHFMYKHYSNQCIYDEGISGPFVRDPE